MKTAISRRRRRTMRRRIRRRVSAPKRRSRYRRTYERQKKKSRRLKRIMRKPRRRGISTKDWILSSAAGEQGLHEGYQELRREETVFCSEAKGLDQPVHSSFRARTVTSPPAFVAVIPKGRVWGPNGVVLTPDNRLLTDVSWEYSRGFMQFNRHSIYRNWKPYPLQTFSGTAGHAAHISGNNYFHWLFDVLPRVGLIRGSGLEADRYIFRGGRQQSYINETLDMMGIPERQRIFTHNHFHWKAQRLIVPSLASRYTWSVYPQPVVYSKWAYDFVRDEFLSKHALDICARSKRLYISRANANQRRLLNEDEILAKLVQLGFTSVDPGTLSVKEQIRLFASAETIVAPHGAGLANLAFCSPGTKVVELFSPVYTPVYYWMLSQYAGLDYYYLVGCHAVPVRGVWKGGMDYYVNPDHFDRLLIRAGIH